jgi:hypothetical protein
MKKLLAVFVVFALVAGSVFADVSMGGSFAYKAELARGDDTEDTTMSAGAVSAQLDLNFSGDNYGGRVRLYGNMMKGWWQDWNGNGAPFAFAWWKPMDQLRIQLGHNADGNFGAAQITGWGYNGSAQDFVAIDNDSGDFEGASAWRKARSAGFYGGFSNVGLLVSVLPVSGFDINLVIPLTNDDAGFDNSGHFDGSNYVKENIKKFHANVVYTIPDIGTARVSFQGLGGKDVDLMKYRSNGTAYASFYITAIQGIRVDFGVNYGLPYNNANDDRISPDSGIGFGLTYTADAFNVKFRAGTTFGGKRETGTKDVDKFLKNPTAIGVGILPSYNMGIMAIYFNMGLGWTIPNKENIEDPSHQEKIINDWFINPYIRIPAGGLAFWAGFKVGSDDRSNWAGAGVRDVIKWSIPIGLSVDF